MDDEEISEFGLTELKQVDSSIYYNFQFFCCTYYTYCLLFNECVERLPSSYKLTFEVQ